jgi:formamidopyrimidine-DNA glycosylase
LKFSSGSKEACFSDPRKFGSILVVDSLEEYDSLAPDAWKDVNEGTIPAFIEKLANQSMGIKAMLLDQRRVISGVGNWVADEVLYQTQLHPDQTFLTNEQAALLLEKLHWILTTAVQCLTVKRIDFPNDWLFHYRWNSKKTTSDAHGRVVTFITSGGRTSAIVPSLQQKKGQSKSKTDAAHTKRKQTVEVKDEELEQTIIKVRPGSTKKRKTVTVKHENIVEMQAIETPSGNIKKSTHEAFQEGEKVEMKATKKSAKKTATAALLVESSSSPIDRRRRSARLSS